MEVVTQWDGTSASGGTKEVALTTRNRFRAAMRLYLANGFDVRGLELANDGDLLIRMVRFL